MQKVFQQLLARWGQLQPREKVLIAGLTVVVLVWGTNMFWKYYQEQSSLLTEKVTLIQNEILWLQTKRTELHGLYLQGAEELSEQALLDAITTTSQELKIQVQTSQVSASGKPSVEVSWRGKTLSSWMHFLSLVSLRGADITNTQSVLENNIYSTKATLTI